MPCRSFSAVGTYSNHHADNAWPCTIGLRLQYKYNHVYECGPAASYIWPFVKDHAGLDLIVSISTLLSGTPIPSLVQTCADAVASHEINPHRLCDNHGCTYVA